MRSLAHYTDQELLDEFNLRTALRRKSQCDFCEAPRGTPTCEQPRRHDPHRDSLVQPHIEITITGPAGSGKSVIASEFRKLAERNGYNLETREVQA